MKARLRVISAAVALATGLAAPALAQDAQPGTAPAIAISPSPPSGEAVGPAQLRDFSLQGTVTRRAETPVQPATRSQSQPRQPAPADSGPSQTVAAPSSTPERPSRPVIREASSTSSAPVQVAGPPSAQSGLPRPDQTLSFSPATMAPEPAAESAPLDNPISGVDGGFISYWPWLIALLAALVAAVWYFRRQRSDYAYALADASAFDLSPPPPPAHVPPRAQPRPSEPQSPPALRAPVPQEPLLKGTVVSTRLRVAPEVKPEVKPAIPSPGIVSARLRPWLDIEFSPLAASFDEKQGVIQFDVTLFNSGSAPARDILLEARLFNAGADQDEVIGKFFENPTVDGERLDMIQPLKRMSFRTSATVPRDQMRIYEAGGRKVWVPLIGFNASYRWSGGDGQTSASYLLGRNTNGEKMAPFRVDLGVRTFNDLGAHDHSVRLRR